MHLKMVQQLSKDVQELTKSGVGVGLMGTIGGAMPGTTGVALTSGATAFAGFVGPIATVSGAGAVMRSFDYLDSRRRRR